MAKMFAQCGFSKGDTGVNINILSESQLFDFVVF